MVTRGGTRRYCGRMRVVLHVVVTAIAVWISLVVPGIELTTGSTVERIGTLLAVGVLFGLVNLLLKPVAKTLGCLLYVLTLGLFGLVVNALLYWLTGALAGRLDLPFTVDGFWPAFWGAIIVSLGSGAMLALLRVDRDRRRPAMQRGHAKYRPIDDRRTQGPGRPYPPSRDPYRRQDPYGQDDDPRRH